eukprot:m.504583 g.504583  ORF g.504583 m.504583 type:complete len:56 (+) comp21862_c0_seq8:1697-1864(+)
MAAPSGVAKQSEVLVTVQLPDTAANVEVTFNGGGSSNGGRLVVPLCATGLNTNQS